MEEHPGPQPLSDLRVVDLTHGIAGPYCTKLLADFGADVIKVERPGSGDYARRLGPFPGDISHPEKSGLFLFLNTNKRGITLDLKTSEGVEALKKLVKEADILVESFKPGVMAKLGLDYDTLSKINPNLVMTSVSNFGQTGPYRDYEATDLTLYAMGGRMNNTGLADRHPLKLGGTSPVLFQAGNNAAMATLFAWDGRDYQSLGGQHLDISILETQLASINMRISNLVQYQYGGERSRRLAGMRPGGGYPTGYYPCRDGFINVNGGGGRWTRTVAMLGRPDLAEDPRFAPPHGQQNPEAKEEFERTIWLPWLMERTKIEIVEECQRFKVNSGAIRTVDEVVDDNPQLDAREYFVEIDHPVAGEFRYLGAPMRTDQRWWRVRRPAPMLGQHTQEVLQEIGFAGASGLGQEGHLGQRREKGAHVVPSHRSTMSSTRGSANAGHHLPLSGVRIIDMTLVFAGPYGTMFLADMGAEVIRVESLNFFPLGSRGQSAHPTKESLGQGASSFPDGEPGSRPWNRVAGFNCHARNKYSMSLDVTTPEGRDAFRRLVEVSDLFIENNAGGSMESLGVPYSVVSQWNPQISVISSTGLGRTGPWGHFRGTGPAFEALCGHASVMGYSDMGFEGLPAAVPSDAATGVTIAMAAVMALRHRERTGTGLHVDISMAENFMPHLGEVFMDYTINGRVAGRMGNRDQWFVQGVYPCAGDDEWIAISIGRIEQWHALCRLMGKPEMIEDRRWSDISGLLVHHDEVDQIIGAWTADQEPIALFHRLQKEGVIAGAVLHEGHTFADPHIKERGFFVSVNAPEVGTHLYPGTTYKMSKTPFEVRKPPVRLGEDNDYIYRDVLGLSEEEYDRMKALGHVGMDYASHVR